MTKAKPKISKEQLERHKQFVSYLVDEDACGQAQDWVKSNKHDIFTAWDNCPYSSWMNWLMDCMTDTGEGNARARQCFPSYATIVRRCVMVSDEAFKKSTELRLPVNKELRDYVRKGIRFLRILMSGGATLKELKEYRKELTEKMKPLDDNFEEHCLSILRDLYFTVGAFVKTKERKKGKAPLYMDGMAGDAEEISERIEILFNEDGLGTKIMRRIAPLNVKACNYFLNNRKSRE